MKTTLKTTKELAEDARRYIGKWLNEEPNANLERVALAELCAGYDDLRAKLDEAVKNYQELLFQVSIKCPGETRHETAPRYLRRAEQPLSGTAQCALKEKT